MEPFENHIKTPWDCMIDILFSFLRMAPLPGVDKPGSCLRTGISDVRNLSKEDKAELEKVVEYLVLELDAWLQLYLTSNDNPATSTGSTGSAFSEAGVSASISDDRMYHESETASAVMLYNATRIIMLSIQLGLASSKPTRDETPQRSSTIRHIQRTIGTHASSILYSSAKLIERNPYSGDAIRSMFPLEVVAILGLESEMRREAQVTLDNKWKQPKIL